MWELPGNWRVVVHCFHGCLELMAACLSTYRRHAVARSADSPLTVVVDLGVREKYPEIWYLRRIAAEAASRIAFGKSRDAQMAQMPRSSTKQIGPPHFTNIQLQM